MASKIGGGKDLLGESGEEKSPGLSHPYMTTGKTIALTRQTFVGKVMSLLFNLLSRSNQSILKEISPGCSLEGLMLKLKLQYFGHLI